jgi:hypothetical protein
MQSNDQAGARRFDFYIDWHYSMGEKEYHDPYSIRQDSLCSDLKCFLRRFCFDEKRLAIIDTESELNVSRLEHEHDCYQFWSTENMMKYVDKERILLSIFPEYHPIR